MRVSSTLVNVADDAELRLVTILGESAGEAFVVDCTACFTGGDFEKLLKTITASGPALQALLKLEAEDVIAAGTLLSVLVQKCKPSNTVYVANALINAICGCNSGSESDELRVEAERKIAVLSVLYNMLDIKCTLLIRILELAGKQSSTLLQPETTLGRLLSSPSDSAFASTTNSTFTPPVVTLLDSWKDGVTIEQRRELYSTVRKILPKDDMRKQRFLLLLLETYTDADSVDTDGIAAAKEAAIGAIRDPITLFRYQRDLLSRPAIQALSKDNADLLGLLTVFEEGKLNDYEGFLSAGNNESVISSKWGLDSTECVRHMRVLSLCSLATEHEEIPYDEIAQTLKLSNNTDQVESWVIAAVNSGLLQAKMDQLAQKVMVERCVVRRFDMEQWKSLKSRLSLWKDHVGGILSALKQSQGDSLPKD